MKLRHATLVVGDIELIKRQYLYHTNAASSLIAITIAIIITAATTTGTKAKTTTINSSPTASTITTSPATTTNIPKGTTRKFWATS